MILSSRFLKWTVLLAMAAGMACSFSGNLLQSATATPPAPTGTPIPSETPVPPATPNLAATRASRSSATAGAAAVDIQAQLTELELPTDGSLGWAQDEPAAIKLDSFNQAHYTPFADGVKVKDFIIGSEITWSTTGWPTCGFIFRSQKNFEQGKQYLFQMLRLSGAPAWSISVNKDGRFLNEPTGTHFSSALDMDNGATNRVVLVVQGNKFVLYINDIRQGQFFDDSKQAAEGYMAYYAWQESGSTECTFEKTWIWQLK